MAYISQESKKEKLLKLKPIFKKYGVRATLSIAHHSKLYLNIWESSIDFIGQYNASRIENLKKYEENTEFFEASTTAQIETGMYNDEFEQFEGKAKQFLIEANTILQAGNFDESDAMTDYFHVGFYSAINIGNWEKPFVHSIIEEELKEEKRLNNLIDQGKLGCKVVDYSEKALAIFGNTKPIKDKLKAIGARFNPFLNNEGEKMTIEVASYQSRILQIRLENGFILKGQDFKSLLNVKTYDFWIEKDRKHKTIKEFNKDKTIEELKKTNLSNKMLKLIIFFQNN
jgi:hypothetical protein